MEAIAKLNNVPTTSRKMRLVVDNIRGKDVFEALNILKFTQKECARRLEKLLLSAINNWEQKHELSPEDNDLYIKETFVNQSRTIKRFRPAPMGRATKIRKRSNHVTMIIGSRTIRMEEPIVEDTIETEE